ncbi:MAG: glycosyltransferase family 4 protein [Propionibacteriaceae bacterium]
MRITQVLTGSTGGIGRHVASVVGRLAAAGHEVVVYAPEETARAHGLTARPLRELGRSRRADVVHAHGLKAGALAVGAELGGPPVVVSWHNEPPRGSGASARLGRLLQRMTARRARVLLGASSDLVAVARQLGAPDARLGPVAAPELDLTHADPAAFRARCGLDGPIVLTVGRLAPQKNLGLVVDVADRLARDDVGFVVVGEGPERPALERRIAAGRGRVLLAGALPTAVDAYAAADVVLLTSTWEARALVAQEALLAGVPLVSTEVGGIVELVGSAARLVPTGDVAAAAAAVGGLLDDPTAAAALAAAGRERAATWPDEDDVATELAALYAAITVGRNAPARGAGSS